MTVSPGEAPFALDSLLRALRYAPQRCDITVINNGGIPDPGEWTAALRARCGNLHLLSPAGPLPRPYFEIARTVCGGLQQIAARPPDLLFRFDPDTVVLNPGFFTDVITLRRESGGHLFACLAQSTRAEQWRRSLRLTADLLPLGLTRGGGPTRYGSRWRLRGRPVWNWRMLLAAGRHSFWSASTHPSGGFFALTGDALQELSRRGWLTPEGANGLEWNDDNLVPLAVRAAGGQVVDLRTSCFAPLWRWMHGSRYFSDEEAFAPGLRGIHPLKFSDNEQCLRRKLDARDSAAL